MVAVFVTKFIEGISIHKPTAAFLTHRDPGHLKRFDSGEKYGLAGESSRKECLPCGRTSSGAFGGPTPKF
jgi:hypothetical protein